MRYRFEPEDADDGSGLCVADDVEELPMSATWPPWTCGECGQHWPGVEFACGYCGATREDIDSCA